MGDILTVLVLTLVALSGVLLCVGLFEVVRGTGYSFSAAMDLMMAGASPHSSSSRSKRFKRFKRKEINSNKILIGLFLIGSAIAIMTLLILWGNHKI